MFCFAKIVRKIVGEYKQRPVYKRYNVVDNGPDSVLGTSGAIIVLVSKSTVFFMSMMSHILFEQTRLMPMIATVITDTLGTLW